MQLVSEAVFGVINKTGSALKDTYLFKNIKKSLYFAVSMYCLTFIGALFNFSTVLILSWIGLFTIPKLYSNNQVFVSCLTICLNSLLVNTFLGLFSRNTKRDIISVIYPKQYVITRPPFPTLSWQLIHFSSFKSFNNVL